MWMLYSCYIAAVMFDGYRESMACTPCGG